MWNLLVIDDEPIVRMGLRWMIDWEAQGVAWKAEASDAEEALQIMESEEIHLVLTDIGMPGMDGLELTRQILKKKPGVQIIIISSYDNFAFAKEALRIGVADYLHKPTMDEEELIASLHKVTSRLKETKETDSSSVMSIEDKNRYLLTLLDRYTFPDTPLLAELGLERYQDGYHIVLFRRREDAIPVNGDAQLRFQSIQYLINEYVTKDWGGIVFHRNYREVILVAPRTSWQDQSLHADLSRFLEAVKQNVLLLLNVALIYSVSRSYHEWSHMPDAYMNALLQLPVNEQSDHYLVRQAKEYVDKHLFEDITLSKVADALKVSAGYLSRIFVAEFGESFSDYVIRNKIEYAQRQLRHTNLKIYEISEYLGYTNPQYFSKLFKDKVGVTPLEYRNQ